MGESAEQSTGPLDLGGKTNPTDSMRRRVLVADDDTAIREFMNVAIEMEGYVVAAARDGAAALDLLASFQPDVIVLDMQMPLMDGRGFADAYRERPGAHAPIIALTASRDPAKSALEVNA